jgi:hypothetical protein
LGNRRGNADARSDCVTDTHLDQRACAPRAATAIATNGNEKSKPSPRARTDAATRIAPHEWMPLSLVRTRTPEEVLERFALRAALGHRIAVSRTQEWLPRRGKAIA